MQGVNFFKSESRFQDTVSSTHYRILTLFRAESALRYKPAAGSGLRKPDLIV